MKKSIIINTVPPFCLMLAVFHETCLKNSILVNYGVLKKINYINYFQPKGF